MLKKLIFIVFVMFAVESPLLSQVSYGAASDLVVCGETVSWELIVEESGTLVIDAMPHGFSFEGLSSSECGATLVSTSPITIDVPEACSIIYEVKANCESFIIKDPDQGGDPDTTLTSTFLFNGATIILDVIASINEPILSIELVSEETNPMPFEPFKRVVRICQDGTDAYLNDDLEVCFDQSANIILNTVSIQTNSSTIPLSVDANNCTSISSSLFIHSLDRQSIPTGFDDFKLEGPFSDTTNFAECLYLEFDLELTACEEGNYNQIISSTWACNNQDCALPDSLELNSNPNPSEPNLELTYEEANDDGCINETFRLKAITIKNTGSGPASNISLFMNVGPGGFQQSASNNAFDAGQVILVDTNNIQSTIPTNNLSTTDFDSNGSQPECLTNFLNMGGQELSTSFEAIIPVTLEVGDSISILVPEFYCCETFCGAVDSWLQSSRSCTYTNICGDTTYQEPWQTLNAYFDYTIATSSVLPNDLDDAQASALSLDITDFRVGTYLPQYNLPFGFFMSVTLDCGLNYNGNAQFHLSDGSLASPDVLNYNAVSRTLYIEFEYPFAHDEVLFQEGSFALDITGECDACGGGQKALDIEVGVILGDNCSNPCELLTQCYSHFIDLHCSNCEWEGITPNSYTIERTNFGFQDYDNDGIADNNSLASANNLDVKKNRATIGDTLKGQWTAIVNTSAAHPIWNYAYAQTIMSGMSPTRYVEVVSAEIEVHDKSSGNILYCNNVPFNQVGIDEANFNFSPINMCFSGCPDLCVFGYQEGDSLVLSAYYKIVDTDICAYQNSMDIQVATDMYAAAIPNPPENDPRPCSTCDPIIPPNYRWTCENYSGSWYMVNPFMIHGTNGTHAAIGCNSVTVSQSFYWSIGGVYGNNFPFEYRPLAITETVWFTVPPNWTVNNWSIVNRVGAGDGSSQGGNKSRVDATLNNAVPDNMDMFPTFGQAGSVAYRFDLEQYFNNGTFTFSDEGSELTVMAELTPTCALANLTGDYTQHLAEFKWLNNNSNCFYDPFLTSRDNINWIKPDVVLQSNKQTIPVECPIIEWPLSAINLSGGAAENSFLYIPTDPAFTINEIRDSNNIVIPKSGDFYYIGMLGGRDQLDLIIEATYSSCKKDSINVFLGWNCEALPTDVSDACDLESIWLYADPGEAALKMSVIEPGGPLNIGLCDSVYFEFGFRNLGDAKAFNLSSSVYLPLENISIVPNSLQIEYPCGSGYVNWASSYPLGQSTILGNLFNFDFTNESTQNSNIGLIGEPLEDGLVFPSVSETENCFNIRFEMVPNGECGFQSSGGTIRTIFNGDNPCGVFGDPAGIISTGIQNATTIEILGSDPYEVSLNASMDPDINACVEFPIIDFSLEIMDDTLTGPNDSIMILVPLGLAHESNSMDLPVTENIQGGIKTLSFPIDPPIGLNEVLNVKFVLATLPELIDCQQEIISIRSATSEELACATNVSGDPCFVNTFTGVEELFVQFDKPDFELDFVSAQSTCGPDSLDTELVFKIKNIFSEDIQADQEIKIDVYDNFNEDCQNISNDSITSFYIAGPIAVGTEMEYTQNVLLHPSVCNLELRIKDCVCTNFISDCEVIEIELPQIADTTVCSGEMFQIETCMNPSLTYEWTALGFADIGWLDDASIPNPSISIPNINGVLEIYEFEVEIIQSPACSLLDTIKVYVGPIFETIQVETLCQGDSLMVADTTFRTTGNYVIQLPTSQACDSIISLDLTVFETYDLQLTDSLCQGESFAVGDSSYSESGFYVDTLLTVDACDSIINLDLTVFPVYTIDSTAKICEGDSIIVGTEIYKTTGFYSDMLETANNCDSLVNLDLKVFPTYEFFFAENICAGDSVLIGDSSFVSTGIHDLILKTIDYCDSTFHLDLTVNDIYEIDLLEEICDGQSFSVGTTDYMETGIYNDTLSSLSGCDSIINLNLTVHAIFDTSMVLEFCEGDSIQIGKSVYKESGNFVDSLLTANDCDSIINLDLTVHPAYEFFLMESICSGDSIFIGDTAFVTIGVHDLTLQTIDNCDSIFHLDLTVQDFYEVDLDEKICAGIDFQVGPNFYSTTGTYTDTLQASTGCDSIVNLNLLVQEAFDSTIVQTICEGDSILIGQNIYKVTGQYLDSLLSESNCDSIVNLDLIVIESYDSLKALSFCEGDSIFFGGAHLHESGIYIDSLLSKENCDSVITLDLEVFPSFEIVLEQMICLGQSYAVGDSMYTATGSYKDTLLTSNDCDSIVLLELTVSDVLLFEIDTTICEGDSININNVSFDNTGTYTDTLLSMAGCDSIVVLNLKVDASSIDTFELTICAGDSTNFGGSFYFETGNYVDTLLNNWGCDSISVLNFTVLESSFTQEDYLLCLGDSLLLNGVQYFSDTVLIDTFTASNLCDSILQANILFLPEIENSNIVFNLCMGDSVDINGVTYEESISFADTLSTIYSCDSIINYIVNVVDVLRDTFDYQLCVGDSVLVNGTYYYESIVFRDTFTDPIKCDSIACYKIKFNESHNSIDTLYLCASDSIHFNGEWITEEGYYQDSLQTSFACDSVIGLQLNILEDFLSSDTLFFCDGQTYGNEMISADTILVDSLVNQYGCDSIIVTNILFSENGGLVVEALEFCIGDTLFLGGEAYTDSGSHTDSLLSNNGCDSILQYNFAFIESFRDTINILACQGDTIPLLDSLYIINAVVSDTLLSQNDCDSIVTYQLDFISSYLNYDTIVLSSGDSVFLQNAFQNNAGVYVDSFLSVAGCDSILSTTVINTQAIQTFSDTIICEGDSIYLENGWFVSDTIVSFSYQPQIGIDSTHTYTVLVQQAYASQLEVYRLCDGDSLWINNKIYDAAGIFADTITSSRACDSILNFEIFIQNGSIDEYFVNLCLGDSLVVGADVYTTSGVHTNYFQNSNGCDSTVVNNLNIEEFVNIQDQSTICDGDSLEIFGNYYFESVSLIDTVSYDNDCDSIFIFDLIVLEQDLITETIDICNGESYTIDSIPESTDGFYEEQYTNQYGCDSIVSIQLNVWPTSLDTIYHSICEGDSLSIGGTYEFTSGTYIEDLLNENSCDSITVNIITVISPVFTYLYETICFGESFPFGNNNYSETGTYEKSETANSGCDSIVVLNLTVLESSSIDIEAFICEGDTYTLGQLTLTQSGQYYDSFKDSNGCDSIVTVYLSVEQELLNVQNISLCDGEERVINDVVYNSASNFVDTLQSAFGCDSIINMNISVAASTEAYIFHDLCEGDSVMFSNQWYNSSGFYEEILINAAGCDSVLSIELEFNQEVEFLTVDTATCINEIIQLEVDAQGEIKWSPITGLSCSSCADPIVTISESTDYKVSYLGCDGVEVEQEVSIEVYREPSLETEEFVFAILGETVTLEASSIDFGADIIWLNEVGDTLCYDCTTIEVLAETDAVYTVLSINENGCAKSVDVQLRVSNKCADGQVEVPNFITPNEDGHNDKLRIRFNNISRTGMMRVYNRWGELVFETSNARSDYWDGTFRGTALSKGVYVYYLEVYCLNDELIIQSGNVTLIN